jgi:uncharacterized protein YdaU (DUF1376 family)
MYSRGGPIADDDAWIARSCGCHIRTWRALKAKLLAAGKLTLHEGFVSNSRVLREIERAHARLKRSAIAAEASVNARRESAEDEVVSANNNGLGKAPAQIHLEPTPTNQPPTTNHQPSADAERIAFDAFVAAAKRHQWPIPQSLNRARRKSIRARLEDSGGLEGFVAALAKAEESKFIRDEMTSWCLDWFLKPANFAKVSEGNYSRGRPPPQAEAARQPMQI